MVLSWNKTVRVLVADDSLVMREIFRELFRQGGALTQLGAPEMQLCGLAQDGVDCLEAVERLRPDILLLDLEMPRMHGLDVLARLRTLDPALPTIMCSASTARGARTTLDGLALGAADYVTKPTMKSDREAAMAALAADLYPKIAGLAGWGSSRKLQLAERSGIKAEESRAGGAGASLTGSSGMIRVKPMARRVTSWGGGLEQVPVINVIAIGVSTGGPSALELLLPRLPANFPIPILIVQHMPKLFSTALAERLNRICGLRVQEANDGASVLPGTIWLAPGDCQMEVRTSMDGRGTLLRLHKGEPTDLYNPSVDYLFSSVAKRYGAGALGVVMTGMGSDGVLGSRTIREAGGAIVVQDEASSAVWGMPGRVAEAGLAMALLPLESLAGELVRLTTTRLHKNLPGEFKGSPRAFHPEVKHGLL